MSSLGQEPTFKTNGFGQSAFTDCSAPRYDDKLAGRPRRLFCFCSLVILDVVCRYLSLFLLYINIEIGENKC